MHRIYLALALCLIAVGPAVPQANNMAPAPAFSGAPVNRSTVNGSVVITTGNTFQTVLAAQTATGVRQQITINNNNATSTENCWIFIGSGTATKGTSILLPIGQSYRREWPFVPSDAIQATCVSNSDTLYIDTQ